MSEIQEIESLLDSHNNNNSIENVLQYITPDAFIICSTKQCEKNKTKVDSEESNSEEEHLETEDDIMKFISKKRFPRPVFKRNHAFFNASGDIVYNLCHCGKGNEVGVNTTEVSIEMKDDELIDSFICNYVEPRKH